jgi:hypothetical protein
MEQFGVFVFGKHIKKQDGEEKPQGLLLGI